MILQSLPVCVHEYSWRPRVGIRCLSQLLSTLFTEARSKMWLLWLYSSRHLQNAAINGRLPYPPDFDIDPKDSNCGLHVCIASPSSTEQAPQLLLAN